MAVDDIIDIIAILLQPRLLAFFGSLADILAERERQMDIQLQDTLIMKKCHPCGCNRWTVLRVGMDFRMKCEGCGHEIMIARRKAEKGIAHVERKGEVVC